MKGGITKCESTGAQSLDCGCLPSLTYVLAEHLCPYKYIIHYEKGLCTCCSKCETLCVARMHSERRKIKMKANQARKVGETE